VATNDLRDAGLRVRAQPFPSTDPTCVTGTVCQQDPAGATQVKKDTIVTIFIGEAAPTSTTTTGP
ncbi:MAG: PASTA domain-containing protein, partial [Actinobacteria bacterium ATB1]|nr:PASTA domain-containing protein [Actinobacteria bacterium ATB1]